MPYGAPCWFELVTSDQLAVKRFYGRLFNWRAKDEALPDGQGAYTIFYNGESSVAAAYTMGPEMAAGGFRPHWAVYFEVSDVDAAAGRVVELGGTVAAGPFDVMNQGRMAVAVDPDGVTFNLWQPLENPGVQLMHADNSVVWVELATRDVERTQAFYSALLTWEIQDYGGNYKMFRTGGRDWGGFLPMDENWADTPSQWNIYFQVADLNDTVALAQQEGGELNIPPFEAPGVGWIAGLGDISGAPFFVVKLTPASV